MTEYEKKMLETVKSIGACAFFTTMCVIFIFIHHFISGIQTGLYENLINRINGN